MISKAELRKQIITAAEIYRDNLAGKKFLYCYGEKYFEVIFKSDRFLHLTGVDSFLSATQFYALSKSAKLSENQFGYNSAHPYTLVKNKLSCLQTLPKITSDLVCVVEDLTTLTMTYKLGLTNLRLTLGLVELTENSRCFVPQTLRVKDKSIENSKSAEFVDFIFSKDASHTLYSEVTYYDKNKCPPEVIKNFLSTELADTLYNRDFAVV